MTKTVNIDGTDYIIESCEHCPFYDWGDAGFLDHCQYPVSPSNLKIFAIQGANSLAKDCPLKDAKREDSMTDWAMTEPVKLKCCPCCGSNRLHLFALDDGVKCWECGLKMVGVEDWAERWNRRVNE